MTIRRRKPLIKNIVTGSPRTGEPVYLVVGKIRRSHGIHGEVLMEVLTDFPDRLKPDCTVYIGEDHKPFRIVSRRKQSQELLLSFEGITVPEETAWLRNQLVYFQEKDIPPLPAGRYYHHQLVGMAVVDELGASLGKLTEIIETGANDVYVVVNEEGKETLLPAIAAVVVDIDLEMKVMRVRLQAWE
jgi:16S rRNA processing protein RimM